MYTHVYTYTHTHRCLQVHTHEDLPKSFHLHTAVEARKQDVCKSYTCLRVPCSSVASLSHTHTHRPKSLIASQPRPLDPHQQPQVSVIV